MKNSINKAIRESTDFIRDNYKELEGACGFPEINGRDRITEWGGTISGVHVLHMSSEINCKDKKIVEKSLGWLLSKQSQDGEWDTGGVCITESTSEILYYILSDVYKSVSSDAISRAIKSIQKNYKDGYFVSTENTTEARVYTTYLAVKALNRANKLDREQKIKIKSWIENIKIHNSWGEDFRSQQPKIAHTIYALKILNICGLNWENIHKSYKKTIDWLFDEINNNPYQIYTFEEFSVAINSSDEYGQQYKRIRIRHFNLPTFIQFLIELRENSKALIITNKLISQQYKGGWGISESELTIWAAQQAIDSLITVRDNALDANFWRLTYVIQVCKVYIFKNSIKSVVMISILLFAFAALFCGEIKDFAFGILIGIVANFCTSYFTKNTI
jgi:hypothetical protein